MATGYDERKKRIMEHLGKSSDTIKSVSVKKTTKRNTPPTPPPVATPSAPDTASPQPNPVKVDQKRRILAHLSRSGSDVGKFSESEEQRKKRIQEHVRKSKS